jgi:hypothetical protein
MRPINVTPTLRNTIQTTSAGAVSSMGGRGGNVGRSTFVGVVLDVCLDERHPLYENDPKNLGKIRFRSYGGQDQISLHNEASIENRENDTNVAYPADRNLFKVPDPGDQILIHSGLSDETQPGFENIAAPTYYYGATLSTTHNVTYNVLPYMGSNVISAGNYPNEEVTANRFMYKLQDPASYTTFDFQGKETLKIYKQLRPYQGDYLLQGSSGNTIRLGSTSATSNSPWSQARSGNSGDPIMLLRVSNDYAFNVSESFTVEDINADDSSIYLCSNQRISMVLSGAPKSRTWKTSLDLEDEPSTNQALNVLVSGNQKINNFIGPQVLLSSDRIVLNTREDYLMLFGGAGVSIESGVGSVNIESNQTVTLFGEEGLYLGVPNKGRTIQTSFKEEITYDASGYEPVVLGKKLEKLLDDFLFAIINSITQETIDKLTQVKDRLPEILSTNVYVDGVSYEKGVAESTTESSQLKSTQVTGNSIAEIPQETEVSTAQEQPQPAMVCSITALPLPPGQSSVLIDPISVIEITPDGNTEPQLE